MIKKKLNIKPTSYSKYFKSKYFIYSIIAIILTYVHVALLNFVAVVELTPDLLLIFCVYIALKEGHIFGIVAGFICGLLFDIVSVDVIGTNALAKTIACFIAGFFYKEDMADKIIGSFKFIFIVFISSFCHNIVYFFFYLRPSEISFFAFFLKYGLALTLYTTVISLILMFAKYPRIKIKQV